MTGQQAEGYKIEAVTQWIEQHIEELKPPFEWIRLLGGHSNLTYKLIDRAGKEAVIRRPPLGELLPKAHDMSREWRVISGLGPTPVPVPQALGFCESKEVTGAPFYVMSMVSGNPLYSAVDTNKFVPMENRETLAFSFFDVLADLHSLDPDELGLSDLGKKEGYVARQLNTWYRSWNASIKGADYDDPRAHELRSWFLENEPDQGPARVVHGDYGLHNCLIGNDGKITSVLDWEISTLGDPLADLAYALNQWAEPNDLTGAATAVPGFPQKSQLASRYSKRTGRDISMLDYYLGFNRWKSAAIVHGVYARYMEGKKSTEGVDLEGLRASIEKSLTLACEAVGK